MVAAALTVGGIVLWSGCSVERDYEVLSFFFDGVPRPGEVGRAGDRTDGTPGGARAVSAHTAFVERRCSDCHGETFDMGFTVRGFEPLDSDSCLGCHGEVLDGPGRLHGPVAARECLWCHQPHESAEPHLLVTRSTELCLRCHGFQLRRGPPMPEHVDLARDCLACHSGHGGAGHAFLLPGWDDDE